MRLRERRAQQVAGECWKRQQLPVANFTPSPAAVYLGNLLQKGVQIRVEVHWFFELAEMSDILVYFNFCVRDVVSQHLVLDHRGGTVFLTGNNLRWCFDVL